MIVFLLVYREKKLSSPDDCVVQNQEMVFEPCLQY